MASHRPSDAHRTISADSGSSGDFSVRSRSTGELSLLGPIGEDSQQESSNGDFSARGRSNSELSQLGRSTGELSQLGRRVASRLESSADLKHGELEDIVQDEIVADIHVPFTRGVNRSFSNIASIGWSVFVCLVDSLLPHLIRVSEGQPFWGDATGGMIVVRALTVAAHFFICSFVMLSLFRGVTTATGPTNDVN